MKEFSGKLQAEGCTFGIVVSRFNPAVGMTLKIRSPELTETFRTRVALPPGETRATE